MVSYRIIRKDGDQEEVFDCGALVHLRAKVEEYAQREKSDEERARKAALRLNQPPKKDEAQPITGSA